MSLAAPEGTSSETAYVCNKSESVLSVIEKCLDNGLGTCLIVEDDQRLAGRISMDDIRQALLDGTAIVAMISTTPCCSRSSIQAGI